MLGKKVGHSRMWDRRSAAGEPGRFAMGLELAMKVAGGGSANQLEASEIRFYDDTHGTPLRETRYVQKAAGFHDVRRGVPTPEGMRVERTMNEKAQPVRVLGKTEDSLLGQFVAMPANPTTFKVGDERSARVWNWEREADERVVTKLERLEEVVRSGIKEVLYVFAVRFESMGVTATTKVTKNGDVLELGLGPGLVLKLEDALIAQSGIVGLDVAGGGLSSPVALGSPYAVERLVLEVDLLAGVLVPSDPAQQVEALGPGQARITRVRGPGAPVTPEEHVAGLVANATVDSDHGAIQAQAKVVTDGATSPRAKVDAVVKWVYGALEKRLATHLPSASAVLEKKVGDCTEHTWLATALLRAAGVAARPVYGVAYTGDSEKSFGYHAWVEVELDGHWVAIDPTWNENVADATHLKLGSELGSVATAIGGVTIKKVTAGP
jgi:hypothetical protein